MELKRGEKYKFEISRERYEIHRKQMEDGTTGTLTIERLGEQWGIFALTRCFRSFNDKYMVELHYLYPVDGPEHGRIMMASLNGHLEKKLNRPIKTEVTEYYEKREGV